MTAMASRRPSAKTRSTRPSKSQKASKQPVWLWNWFCDWLQTFDLPFQVYRGFGGQINSSRSAKHNPWLPTIQSNGSKGKVSKQRLQVFPIVVWSEFEKQYSLVQLLSLKLLWVSHGLIEVSKGVALWNVSVPSCVSHGPAKVKLKCLAA